MLLDLFLLLAFQLLGELLVFLLALPVPGPVVGLVLLFALCLIRRRVPATLETTARALLAHLSLLFVPAGVGVMLHFARIATEWPAILAALVLSTWIAVAVSGRLFAALLARTRAPAAEDRP